MRFILESCLLFNFLNLITWLGQRGTITIPEGTVVISVTNKWETNFTLKYEMILYGFTQLTCRTSRGCLLLRDLQEEECLLKEEINLGTVPCLLAAPDGPKAAEVPADVGPLQMSHKLYAKGSVLDQLV